VDDLHEAAGSKHLIHMHGELNSSLCRSCGGRNRWKGDMTIDSRCLTCESVGRLRPDIVWFGEMPYAMDRIYGALAQADLFIAIGTSGEVYPAADFVEEANLNGAHTVTLNLEPSDNASAFAEAIHGRASEIVPTFVDRLLSA
jgi:NAD-dependent deacetylase